jgi:hypothetical protein
MSKELDNFFDHCYRLRCEMSISKKLFVLLLAAMILAALSSVVLVLAGHEALVRDAWRTLVSSSKDTLLGAVLIIGFALVVVFT